MGKTAFISEPLQQLGKHLTKKASKAAKHVNLNKIGQELAPDYYHSMMKQSSINNYKTRANNHPGAFSQDMEGIVKSGALEQYVNDLPDEWKSNFTNHRDRLPPDEQADWDDLIIRAAGGEEEAQFSVSQASKALEVERTGKVRESRVNKINQQSPEPEATKQKQIRQQSTERMDRLNAKNLGEEEWAPMRQAGKEGKGLKEDLIDGKGQNIHTSERVQGLAPHHLSEKAFDEKAIRNWPEEEQVQYIRDMNSVDIFPGNHPRNWIGLFHDNTLGLLLQQKKAVNDLRIQAGKAGIIDEATGKPYAPLSKREIDNWYKADAHVSDKVNPEYGKAEIESSDPEIRAEARDELMAGTIKRDWSQILPPGKTIKDIKARPPIISRDHQEFVHGIINRLPSTKRIKELQESGEWDALPYRDRIAMLMRNAIEKQNVAFNVALMRINMIREAMGKPNATWDDIVAWIAQQPKRAASIGWYDQIKRGGDLYNQLKTTPEAIIAPLSEADETLVANVFGMTRPPQTTKKFAQWLKTNGY